MIGGAQNRITAKQLREEELAAAENPGYGNSLLKIDEKGGIILSNKLHSNRDLKLEEVIKKAIFAKEPVFDEHLAKHYNKDLIDKGYYGVVLHGQPQSVLLFDYILESKNVNILANIIKNRSDYSGEPIFLVACNTGKETSDKDCFAQVLANALNVDVKAPTTCLTLTDYEIYFSDENCHRVSGEYIVFHPRYK